MWKQQQHLLLISVRLPYHFWDGQCVREKLKYRQPKKPTLLTLHHKPDCLQWTAYNGPDLLFELHMNNYMDCNFYTYNNLASHMCNYKACGSTLYIKLYTYVYVYNYMPKAYDSEWIQS